jgi:hypothetical protein
MSVSNSGRNLGLFLVLVLASAAVVGWAWYKKNGPFWDDDQEAFEDDEPANRSPDAGPSRRPKKGSTRRRKKRAEPRAPRVAAERPERPERAERQATLPMPTGPSGPSYETAIAGNNLNLAPGTTDVPDLSDGQLSYPMRDGSFLDACGVPSSTKVTVKVAIRNGQAVGVSVYTSPPNKPLGWCVEKQVRGFQWPSNAKMDSFITTY